LREIARRSRIHRYFSAIDARSSSDARDVRRSESKAPFGFDSPHRLRLAVERMRDRFLRGNGRIRLRTGDVEMR
jgi:hypothetical protein